MARFIPGHYLRMTLSPVSAISDMVAPVVLITAATMFVNGLMTAVATVVDNAFALNRERLAILRGPHGEVLAEDSVPPLDRERLVQISHEVPLMVRRVRRIRNAVVIIWLSVGLFVLSVVAIAVAVTARSEGFAFTALGLVIAGVAGVLAGVASVIAPAARSPNALIEDAIRTGTLS